MIARGIRRGSPLRLIRLQTVTTVPAAGAKVEFCDSVPRIAVPGPVRMARHWQRHIGKMQVLCAWCRRESKPGYLGEREPLENPGPTHGVCAHHMKQLLESLPSRSFPDAELLVVVRRDDTTLYERLQRSFAGVTSVKVIMDRRLDDRRSAQRPVPEERRYVRTRRIRLGMMSPVGGYTVVRFTPRVPTLPR